MQNSKPFDIRTATTPDLEWMHRLPEVGKPVMSDVASIRDDLREAREAFDRAELHYAEAIDRANRRAEELQDYVGKLWTAQEIDLAKRGKVLVHGIEVDYE